MGSGLTIDNVPGPVFEAEDQQFWISGVGPASCQMWDVRPDPFFSLKKSLRPFFFVCPFQVLFRWESRYNIHSEFGAALMFI
jgi:hypothetical protein